MNVSVLQTLFSKTSELSKRLAEQEAQAKVKELAELEAKFKELTEVLAKISGMAAAGKVG